MAGGNDDDGAGRALVAGGNDEPLGRDSRDAVGNGCDNPVAGVVALALATVTRAPIVSRSRA